MFSWLRKKGPILTEGEQRALRMGQETGAEMGEALNTIMELRFKPVFEGYLGVLRDKLHTSFGDKEAPPIWLTRVHYANFVDNVAELKPKMTEEIYQRMADWVRAVDEIGVRTEFDQSIIKLVDDFTTELTAAGMKLVADYGEGLIEADKAWRNANPERAAQFPMKD